MATELCGARSRGCGGRHQRGGAAARGGRVVEAAAGGPRAQAREGVIQLDLRRRFAIIPAVSDNLILPVAVRGISSSATNTIRRGILKLDREARRPVLSDSSLGAAPLVGTTAATTSWPNSGSGSPATTDRATSGKAASAASTSSRETFAPRVLIMSSRLPAG